MASSTRLADPTIRGRVLLAEDNTELRSVLAGVLRRRGLDVVEAVDGQHLLAHLARCVPNGPHERPDVILSDVRMPGCSGLAILRGLHASSSAVPIVLMTAFPEDELRERALEDGALAVLDKPLDLDELLRVVTRALFNAPALD